MPNTPSLKAKVRGIDKILKALPEIKERLSKDNSWESIKSLCQPLGLTDTAFRDNPRVNDYLLSEKYWQDRLKKLLPKGKPQSPQPVWAEELYKLDIADPDDKGCTITLGEYLRVDCPELEGFITNLLASQTSTLKGDLEESIKKMEAIKYNEPLDNEMRIVNMMVNSCVMIIREDILNSL